MKSLRRLVVTVLLGVWCSPAVGLAKPLTPSATELGATPTSPSGQAPKQAPAQRTEPATLAEALALAEREAQARDLQDFRGGSTSIYIGSGALFVLVIVLLIILF